MTRTPTTTPIGPGTGTRIRAATTHTTGSRYAARAAHAADLTGRTTARSASRSRAPSGATRSATAGSASTSRGSS